MKTTSKKRKKIDVEKLTKHAEELRRLQNPKPSERIATENSEEEISKYIDPQKLKK